MTTPLVIVASSGYLAEVISIVDAPMAHSERFHVAGVIHDGDFQPELSSQLAERLGVPTFTDVAEIPRHASIALTVGPPAYRAELTTQLTGTHKLATLVHRDATIGRWVELGEGTIVSPGARITASVTIGRGCLINTATVLSHDDVIGDFVTISPSATLCGGVTVGDRTSVFAGATVMPGVTIGADVTVGAGALVNADVAPGTTVVGVPARPLA
ncbi:MAG: sugar O-acyltransferase (sialic acid O-acetyltransferase NeuD family) [Candidatus Poriferisodalaceae bacterium]